MQILTDIGFLIAITMLAVCITGIVEGVREDSEKRRLIRREHYRREAYRKKDVERCREILWEAYTK
jgi:hypothetical protein